MLTPIDPAELPEAQCSDDLSERTAVCHCRKCGKESELSCAHCGSIDVEVDSDSLSHSRPEIRAGQAVAVARWCARLLEMGRTPKDLFKAVNAFAFAAHLHPEQSLSQEQIAARFGITKQAFSKAVNHYRDRLGLPRNGGAMSNAARRKFRTTAKKAHEKRDTRKSRSHQPGFARLLKVANH